ncbi:hypothetical protein [Fertoeibacter niger]|nr:hypothetical protein [Fertoeibacter niger]
MALRNAALFAMRYHEVSQRPACVLAGVKQRLRGVNASAAAIA